MALSSILCIVVLLVGLAVDVQATSLKFNTPTRPRFTINQNFQNGRIITDNIECISSGIDDPIVYSFLNSSWNQLFHINSSLAVLTMAVDAMQLPCINCEFHPTLVCTAGVAANATRITIYLELENEFEPTFTDSYLSRSVPEDVDYTVRPSLTIVNATDEDCGDCGVVTFSIISGNSEGRFQINSSSGSLEVVAPLDYEGTTNSYLLRLEVSNTLCTPSLTDEIFARVDVTNVNDEPPVFNPRTYSAIVNEFDSHPNNRTDFIKQLRCSDLDTDSSYLKYEKMFSNELFDVNFHTGEVFISPLHELDYEERTFYELQFKCFDFRAPDMFDIANLTVQILPVNEHGIELSGFVGFAIGNDLLPVGTLIASNLPDTEALISIGAVDRDEGSDHGVIRFAFKDAQNEEYFHLEQNSGNITLIKSLIYRYCADQPSVEYETIFIPLAVCGANIPNIATCLSYDIRLFTSISGNCTPSFDQNSFGISVNESTSTGTVLYNFNCNTPGSINVATDKSIELEGLPNATKNFDVTNDGSLVLQDSLDFESETNYNFTIYCIDLISNLTAEAAVNVTVLPSNDFAPMFTHPFFTFSPEDKINIGQVEVTDGDRGIGNELTYNIISGDNNLLFIDSSGKILLADNFVRSTTCDKLAAVIEVSDGLYTDQAMILVNLTQVIRNLEIIGPEIFQGCDEFCIAFAVVVIVLIFSLLVHIFTCVLLVLCHRKKQRNNVVKIQNSILEKAGSIRRDCNGDNSHNYSLVNETVTVPCPMYSTVQKSADDIYHYASTGRCGLELPPIPDEKTTPSRRGSGKMELVDYLEMHSAIYKRDRCGSDPMPVQRFHMTTEFADSSPEDDIKKMDLLDGQISPRLSVDNIYETIVNV